MVKGVDGFGFFLLATTLSSDLGTAVHPCSSMTFDIFWSRCGLRGGARYGIVLQMDFI